MLCLFFMNHKGCAFLGSCVIVGSQFAVFCPHIDSMEVKPIMTRKLRRRPNDPVPIPDKRRKPAPDILHVDLESLFKL